MATFRGPMTGLVLQDEATLDGDGNEIPGVVWARSESGVVVVDDASADRFRSCAESYGFTEDAAPAPVAKSKTAPPAADPA